MEESPSMFEYCYWYEPVVSSPAPDGDAAGDVGSSLMECICVV